MDLSTMAAKLAQGLYKDRFGFQADFRVMINNAKQYNLTGSYAHNEAITLETMFEKSRPFLEYRDRWLLTLEHSMDPYQQDIGSCRSTTTHSHYCTAPVYK
jgi:hypothetical protein